MIRMIDCPGLAPDVELWRYVSFSKLAVMLSKRALFFARCDTFNDPFDGALGKLDDKETVLGIMDPWANKIAEAAGLAALGEMTDTQVQTSTTKEMQLNIEDAIFDKFKAAFLIAVKRDGREKALEDFRKHSIGNCREEMGMLFKSEFDRTFVSCWHCADHESEAMWRLYAKDTNEGVAIRTTIEQLLKALPQDRNFTIRRVDYRDDYRHTIHDTKLKRFYTKRRPFAHEKEVRIILEQYSPQKESGVSIPVDIDQLLLGVTVSPFAPAWFPPVVLDLCAKFGVKSPVQPSNLIAQPLFG